MKNREIKVVLQEEAIEELEYFTIKVVACPCKHEELIAGIKEHLKSLMKKEQTIITPTKPCGCNEKKEGAN